jgi:DNA-binding transcriptional ArsR family regulator
MNGTLEPFKALLGDKLHTKLTEDHVQSVLSVRRGRETLFGQHLFSDPAWDILLELYAARLGKRSNSTDELARSLGVPHCIIERWIRALENSGLVEESIEPQRIGPAIVSLTDEGATKMTMLVDQWSAAFLAI